MTIKTVLIVSMLIVLNACAGTVNKVKNESSIVRPIPLKCGKFNIVYGNIEDVLRLGMDVDKRENTRFNLLFKDKNDTSVDTESLQEKYGSKTLLYAMESWQQMMGGLPYPDGSGGRPYTNMGVYIKLIQVVEHGKIDMENLDIVCASMRKKK